jgi:hypothetical protein
LFQSTVYALAARPAVQSCLEGYNAAIIAYGQTGTGKTYTMEGEEMRGEHRGIIPRAIEDVFSFIQNDGESVRSKFLVRASYLQIYNEVISDLLKPENTNLQIREDRKRGVYVDRLSEWVVRSPVEVYELMERGSQMRATGATKLNEVSSRSHAVLIVIVENAAETGDGEDDELPQLKFTAFRGKPSGLGERPRSVKVGKLNLVDLAGSERVHLTGATGKRLEESKNINQSLASLGNVIAALTDTKPRKHIPYRDSKLTRILEDSLGGNCKTTMMAMVSPAVEAMNESVSTLAFANRAKNIKNRAKINEDLDQRALLRKYERELKRLRSELDRRTRQLLEKREVMQDGEGGQASGGQESLPYLVEQDRLSQQLLQEKAEKRQLEERIAGMQSQLLLGGVQPTGTNAAFKQLIERERRTIAQQYEERLREMERELRQKEKTEETAQVERYKQLLLKQRDIMIALTARLNERDEQILTLQEELEAYDKYQRQLEDRLDDATRQNIVYKRHILEEQKKAGMGAAQGEGMLEGLLEGGARGTGGRAAPGTKAGAVEVGFDDDATPAPMRVMSGSGGGSGMSNSGSFRNVAPPSTELRELRAKVNDLTRENVALKQRKVDEVGDASALEAMAKEREALRTILDQRMQPLVADISLSVAGENPQNSENLQKQVRALARLLRLTMDAMGEDAVAMGGAK